MLAYYNPAQGSQVIKADDETFDPSQRVPNTGVAGGAVLPPTTVLPTSGPNPDEGGMTGRPVTAGDIQIDPYEGSIKDPSPGPGASTSGPLIPSTPMPATTLSPGAGGAWDMDGKTGSIGDFLKELQKRYGGASGGVLGKAVAAASTPKPSGLGGIAGAVVKKNPGVLLGALGSLFHL